MDREDEKKMRFATEISSCTYRESVFYTWMKIILDDKSPLDFLKENRLNRVIVYGYGKIGKLLCQEIMKEKTLELVAVIDRNASDLNWNVRVISPNESLPTHDILISTIVDTNYVRNKLNDKSDNIVDYYELLRGYIG